jgi:integrase
MKDAALGLAGILTSGTVGIAAPWVAYRFARKSQAAGHAHERDRADRAELRILIDEAAVALHTASYARGDAEVALMQHATKLGERRPDVMPAATAAGKALDELQERLAIRLGREHPAATAFGDADSHRPQILGDEDERRPLNAEQLDMFLRVVHPSFRLLFDVAARTGLRASELIALDGRHLHLSGDRPHIRVRQRYRDGQRGALKSGHARRAVPLAADLVDQLRALDRGPDEIVFQTTVGTRLSRDNVRNRIIKPAAEEAGAPWAGWHTFRHTAASRLFAEGRNVKQVQKWFGHHAPSFTLDTYVHLLDDDLGEPLGAPMAGRLRTFVA